VTEREYILIVDDDDTIAVGLADYLKFHGSPVEIAHDFEAARSLIANRAYAIAIIDIVGTGDAAETGMAFLEWLLEKSPQTLVVVLTAYRTAWLEHFALSLGVAFFLDKPKSFDEIVDVLSTVLTKPVTAERQ
jgi:two-component system, NtrC family, response regulator PilR